jgi:cathepsin D
MHFSLTTILAVVPLVLSAANTTQTPPATIPLKRHGSIYRSDGSVDLEALKRNADYTAVYVIPPFNLQMPCDSSYRKRLHGFINYEHNTGKPHPGSLGIKNIKRLVVNNQLQDVRNLVWMGPISVGTPPVQFNVNFDTGRGSLFLADIGCQTCLDRTRYHPTGSSTAHALARNFNIGYADGSSASGQLYTDTVRISGLTAIHQTLGAVSVWHDAWRTIEDGVMGMAF